MILKNAGNHPTCPGDTRLVIWLETARAKNWPIPGVIHVRWYEVWGSGSENQAVPTNVSEGPIDPTALLRYDVTQSCVCGYQRLGGTAMILRSSASLVIITHACQSVPHISDFKPLTAFLSNLVRGPRKKERKTIPISLLFLQQNRSNFPRTSPTESSYQKWIHCPSAAPLRILVNLFKTYFGAYLKK